MAITVLAGSSGSKEMALTPLDRSFFERPLLQLTEALVGQLLVRRLDGELLVGRIVETEAYGGPTDPSAHSYTGVTGRCFAMFGPAGRSYVYATQGRCFCMNIIAEGSGKGRGVLIRAIEPVAGHQSMLRRRQERLGGDAAKRKLASELHELGKGPGRYACSCVWRGISTITHLCGGVVMVVMQTVSVPGCDARAQLSGPDQRRFGDVCRCVRCRSWEVIHVVADKPTSCVVGD